MWIYAMPLMAKRSRQEARRVLREHGAAQPGRRAAIRHIQQSAEHQRQVRRLRWAPAHLVRRLLRLLGKCSKSGGSI